jgi:NADP-reducing hydrogenase subunit HndB
MPQLCNAEELADLKEALQKDFHKMKAEKTIITVGMGTCGLAAGAGDTYQALLRELEKRDLQVIVRSVGCIGICVMEPLLDVQLPGQPRVTYTNVRPANVSRILDEHVLNGKAVKEWVIGAVPEEW